MSPETAAGRGSSVAHERTVTHSPGASMSRLRVGLATSVGRVRSANEDSILCEPVDAPTVRRRGLFCAVADGMGGHAAGDVASALAVQTARDVYYGTELESADEALRLSIERANSAVYAAGAGKSGRDQMGSTITAAVVQDDRALIGHVGDSRCYILGKGRIRQLTRDHSWVGEEVRSGALTPEEARIHPRRNIITRALGLQAQLEVDLEEATVEPGGVLLLCSDGLHGLVRDEEILSHVDGVPPQEAADRLVALANERGSPDNVSAVLVEIGAGEPVAGSEPEKLEVGGPAPARDAPVGDGGPVRGRARVARGGLRGAPMAIRTTSAPGRQAGAGRGMVLGMLVGLVLMGAALAWLFWSADSRPRGPGPSPVATMPPATPVPTPAGPPPTTVAPTPAASHPRPGPATVGAAVPGRATPSEQTATVFSLRTQADPPDEAPTESRRELRVMAEDAAVRLAPVDGAPVVGRLQEGVELSSESEVIGESIDGGTRWYLVSYTFESTPERGFIHSSVVRELP